MSKFNDSLKNLRNLFWEADESSESQEQQANALTPAPGPPAAKVDQKIEERLLKALQQSKSDEFGYLQFKDAVHDLASDMPDESLRYRAAFKTARTLGVTVAKLVDAANHHIGILAAEKKEFEATQGQHVQQEITGREKAVATLDTAIQKKQIEIQKLNEEIQTAIGDKQKLSVEISDSRSRIENLRNAFGATYEGLVATIKQDIKKIQTYLKE